MPVTPPTTENKEASTADKIISSLGNTGVKIVEDLIITDVPWLGWPVVKTVWEFLFGWIASYFIKGAQNGATFAIIDTQVGAEETGISKALAEIIAAEKSGDAARIKAAIQAYADAQSALVHSDGSHHATG